MSIRFPDILVRTFLRILWDKAIDTPAEVADIFVEFSPHVNRVDVRGFAGGWRSGAKSDFELSPNFDFASEERVREEASAALAQLEKFIAAAPGIAKARAESEAAGAAKERQAFGDAVARYREAMDAGADENALRAMRIAIDEMMGAMRFGAKGGIWWDAQHGTWGLGVLDEEDREAAESGAVISGPHA